MVDHWLSAFETFYRLNVFILLAHLFNIIHLNRRYFKRKLKFNFDCKVVSLAKGKVSVKQYSVLYTQKSLAVPDLLSPEYY